MRPSQHRHLEPGGGGEESRRIGDLGITYDNVVHIVVLDLGSQINVNLNPVLRVLFFDGV